MTLIFIYIAYFVFSTLAPLQRRFIIAKHNLGDGDQIRLAFEVMLILAVGSIFFQFFSPLYFTGDTFYLFVLSLVCGLTGMGYFIMAYTAQKYVDASVTNVVQNIYTPVTIFLSSIFLGEGLTPMQIVGTILLLIAIFLISQKHKISTFRFDKYVTMMFLSGFLLAVLLIAERALQKETGLSGSTMLSWGAQALCLGVASFYYKSKHSYNNKEVLLTGGSMLLAASSYVVLVFTVGNLSLVSSVTTFKIVTIFIAAAIFLKERDDLPRKILGSIIALVGLLLLR